VRAPEHLRACGRLRIFNSVTAARAAVETAEGHGEATSPEDGPRRFVFREETVATDVMFITRRELGAMLTLSPKTLEAWSREGYGPRPVKIGPRRIAYKLSTVTRWLRANGRYGQRSAPRPTRSRGGRRRPTRSTPCLPSAGFLRAAP
jgi:predicted DNA-binding transcriptional regulator AlpA